MNDFDNLNVAKLECQLAEADAECQAWRGKYEEWVIERDNHKYAMATAIERAKDAEARLAVCQGELEIAMRQGGTARTELMLENRDLRERLKGKK